MARQRRRARKNATRSANPRRVPITVPATCPADMWWPLEVDNWSGVWGSTGDDSTDEPAEPESDEVEDTSRSNGRVDDERDCAGVVVVAVDDGDDGDETERDVVVIVDAVPEVKAEPEAEAGSEVEPPLESFVTTKQSIVNSLEPAPSPTTSLRTCCWFWSPLTLKNV